MTDRVAIITGGGRGVGRGITRRFLETGAHVVICGRNEPTEPVSDAGREALFVQADVRDPAQIQKVVDAAKDTFGRLDVLINNAGGTAPTDTLTVSPKFHNSIVDLNLISPLNFSVAAYHAMKEQEGSGSIVFISSVSANVPDPVTPAYAAAKAGISNLTQSLAMTFAPKVRVNTVIAGLILTDQSQEYYGEDGVHVRDQIPLGRMGTPEDVGDACLLLSEPRYASWITGARLECHGGLPIPLTQVEEL
ncbi:MAG: SDR family oxidoreductase [Myxococcales bacterium]|nr:SDR family oxidoreductase [Myxococcales bacterium]